MHIGGQEHFYLETNVTLAVPLGEDGEMELFVSTQSAAKTQVTILTTNTSYINHFIYQSLCIVPYTNSMSHIGTDDDSMHLSLCQSLVAKALGVPANRVVVRVKRMGGGFGGKESRTTVLSTVVAVAANKYV